MKAGRMDRRVTLERATVTRNAVNEKVPSWSPLATVWAEKEDLRDSERVRAAQVNATVTTRFRIRWAEALSGLSARDRLTCEGITYQIRGVKALGRRTGLEISASAEGLGA